MGCVAIFNQINAFVAPRLHSCRRDARESSSGDEGIRDGREEDVAKEDRGFASMDRSKQREIASKGGKAAHEKGTAHEWTSEEARDAGRKGGIASHRRRREQAGGPEGEDTGSTEFEPRPTRTDEQPNGPVE